MIRDFLICYAEALRLIGAFLFQSALWCLSMLGCAALILALAAKFLLVGVTFI